MTCGPDSRLCSVFVAMREELSTAAIDSSGNKLVVRVRPGCGRITCATRNFAAGEVLLVEKPVVAVQLPGSARVTRICAECACQLGTASTQFEHMGIARVPAAAASAKTRVAAAIACEHCDAVWYCCKEHREAHRARSHGAICSSKPTHRAKFAAFKAFATAHCQSMLLAGEMFAHSVMH